MSNVLQYPGDGSGRVVTDAASLANEAVACTCALADGRLGGMTVTNRHTGQVVGFDRCLPRLVLGDGRVIDLTALSPINPVRAAAGCVSAMFHDEPTGLRLRWTAMLLDDSNALIVMLDVGARRDVTIDQWVFCDQPIPGATQVGQTEGSVVVAGDIFMAVEHPLASNVVTDGVVRCALQRNDRLKAGESANLTMAIGVVPPNQLRRGFLYYLEQRRGHRYRPFLHYNSWYDVHLIRPVERTDEAECLDTIEYFGRELVEKRGVPMDAFVWDDGWDDHESLWQFHRGFPNGFKKLSEAAGRYGAGMGVWMSPWGGYGPAKDRRIAWGKSQGYETNANGYAMAGPRYAEAFKDACLTMMREQGVVFLKFDGMGAGNEATGAAAELRDDIHAMLAVMRTLRREELTVYLSATIGTWASPYWLFYADSIWRQGGDSGHHGRGDTRQQWITYRDKYCYERIVQRGPLYPMNAMMLHGILIGNRPGRAPAGMAMNEKSIADEIWSYFASGTGLQELYISPNVMSEAMLDELAAAAKWSRTNAETLIDTHWIGGNPGAGEVYGRAAWQPRKGIITLRNPDDQPQTFTLTLRETLELTDDAPAAMKLNATYPADRPLPDGPQDVDAMIDIAIEPFETLVIETSG